MCGGRAELPSLIPSSFLLPFFIPRASLHLVFLQEHQDLQWSFPPTATHFISSFSSYIFTPIFAIYVCGSMPCLQKLALLSFCYIPTSFLYKKMLGCRHSLGISWTSALCAPTGGGCHWPRMGGGRDFVRLEGQDSGGLCTSWWQHFTTRAVFQAETEKQMFASAPRRKSSWEVVASQAVCNFPGFLAWLLSKNGCQTALQ